MDGVNRIDSGRRIDWGKTSDDYTVYRPGPPDSFFERLRVLGVGIPGQCILDLGTGTGVMARRFAQQGSAVAGIDISAEQIAAARELASTENLEIDFRVAAAEETPFSTASFDVVTANQCWLYFDKRKAIAEVKRLLRPGGLLVTSHFSWLPRLDNVARQTEGLVLRFNPQWTTGDWDGVILPMPTWAEQAFSLRAMFYYDEPIPFTRETWRGRIRACRGVGAELNEEEVRRFDAAHAELLAQIVPVNFTVLHRLDAHLFEPKSSS
jgi:SAM-dependent methyltransferase